MSITLTIGAVIPFQPGFYLHVKSMSGDADVYETNTSGPFVVGKKGEGLVDGPELTVTQEQELADKLGILLAVTHMRWHEAIDDDKVAAVVVVAAKESAYFIELAKGHAGGYSELAIEWYHDMVGGDVTCEGERRAKLDEVWVTYVDEDGGNRSVVMSIDGRNLGQFANSRDMHLVDKLYASGV